MFLTAEVAIAVVGFCLDDRTILSSRTLKRDIDQLLEVSRERTRKECPLSLKHILSTVVYIYLHLTATLSFLIFIILYCLILHLIYKLLYVTCPIPIFDIPF